MLFFQAALLAGYAYSHASIRVLGLRRHAMLHGVLVWLPLLLLPIVVNQETATATDHPIAWLLQTMGVSVGLPFVVLASTAPLLQRWYSSLDTRSSDPYWLYSASNVRSFAALLAFPILLEPAIPLGQQTAIWKTGYAIVAALLTACAIAVLRRSSSASEVARQDDARAAEPITAATRLRWLALSFAPSTLMLGVTTFLSTDVAPVLLLWVLPGTKKRHRREARHATEAGADQHDRREDGSECRTHHRLRVGDRLAELRLRNADLGDDVAAT